MLGHRLRRWPNIKPALSQRLVLAGQSVWFGHGRLKSEVSAQFPAHLILTLSCHRNQHAVIDRALARWCQCHICT